MARLKARANDNVHNLTQVLSATDTSPGELDPDPVATDYCHRAGRGSPTSTPTAPGW